MKISIFKSDNRYSFSLNGFSSFNHSNVLSRLSKDYDYPWQALRDAKWLFREKPYHLDVYSSVEDLSRPVRADIDAEDMLLNHYQKMRQEMSRKVMGIDDNTEEERQMTYLVLKSQVEDLLRIKENIKEDKYKHQVLDIINDYKKIVSKYFSDFLREDLKKKEIEDKNATESFPPLTTPLEEGEPSEPNLTLSMSLLDKKDCVNFSEKELDEIYDHYGCAICEAISKHHSDAIYKLEKDNGKIEIFSLDQHNPLLNVSIGKDLLLRNIYPSDNLMELFPSYSLEFYQRYWKPIVERVGHFIIEDLSTLILPRLSVLPDMPNSSSSFDLKGWDPFDFSQKNICLNFDCDSPIWLFSSSSKDNIKVSKIYTEEDFLKEQPARVKCVDSKLSLYNKIGEVVQVIPINSGIGFELDVNFGRKIVRLSQDQVEIVDAI